jgi:Pilus formation protein N terminal region
MSAVFGRSRRLFGVTAAALFVVAGAVSARADIVRVNVDSARLLKLPARVATIVIGNPLIADATLQSDGVLVLTGKGYGSTNLVALDRKGQVVMRETVQVLGPRADHLIVVYRGTKRETWSCVHQCQPRNTLGDDQAYFAGSLGQTTTRNAAASTGGSVAPAPSAPR